MLKSHYIYRILALSLFILLIIFQLYKVFHTPFGWDAAIFAIVAKNLATGYGYAAIDYKTFLLFHHGITSGPIVIIPAAFMMALLGNVYWVPGLTAVLLITLLLVVAFYQLGRIAPVTKWHSTAAFLLAAMVLTNHDIGFADEHMMVWHSLLGEVPSALFVIIAALVMAHQRYHAKEVFLAGIIAGLGGLCKLQSLIGSGTLGLYLVITYLNSGALSGLSRKQAMRNICLYGTGILGPLAVFEIVKMLAMGLHDYVAMVKNLLFFFQDLNQSPDTEMLFRKLYIFGQYVGICSTSNMNNFQSVALVLIPVVFFVVILYCSSHYIRSKNQLIDLSPVAWAAGAFLWCAAVHISWYLFINTLAMPRYLTQGMLYGCSALALMIFQTPRHNFLNSNVVFAMVLVVLLCCRSDAAEYLWAGMKDSEDFEEQQYVYQTLKIIQEQEPDTLFFSCGYTFELEYLLPRSANFVQCDTMRDPAFTGRKRILITYTPVFADKVLHAAPDGHKIGWRSNPEIIRKDCPKYDIYAGKHYFIASCRGS